MSEIWKEWEGRTVDGRFPLGSYLGSSGHSAVFLTSAQGDGTAKDGGASERAAIKLIVADPVDAERQLRRWQAARELKHPNLIRIFQAGRCELEGRSLLYVVMEYAEENLSQILPERALTAEETRGMLAPVLLALQYAHGKNFVHERVQPSNILAVGDEVKLSSDALIEAGEGNRGEKVASGYDPPEVGAGLATPAVNVWQLGMTLVEVLTQRLPHFDTEQGKPPAVPGGIPQPFQEMIENCLRVDPARRWTVTQIAECLERPRSEAMAASGSISSASVVGEGEHSAKWPYAIGIAAVALLVVFLVARPKPQATTAPQSKNEQDQSVTAPVVAPPVVAPPSPTEAASPKPTSAAEPPASGGAQGTPSQKTAAPGPGQGDSKGRVVLRVVPKIPPGALHSITGKIHIRVKVNVDETGRVTEARLKSPGPSKYFAERAVEAARGWKFEPARENGHPIGSQWMVQFTLTRRAIDDSIERIEP
ncbi:MAG: TonB family protein [Terriglobales bacterium]